MFSFKRMAGVMKRDWANNRKTFFILMAVLFLVQFAFSFVFSTLKVATVIYLGLIVAIGKLVFWDYPNGNRRLEALLLPASNAEKYASQWLWAFVILPISVVVAVAAGQFLGFTLITLAKSNIWINPLVFFIGLGWDFALRMLIVESVTFAGCLLFRKSRTLKTWLVAAGYAFIMFTVFITIVYFKFVKDADTVAVITNEQATQFAMRIDDAMTNPWWSSDVALAITAATVIVFLHVWTYLRLKDEEA